MSGRLKQLVILHTNDIHSHFEQMPKIAAYFAKVRESIPTDSLLTLDIGDHMDRMYAETEGTSGLANVAIMNATGYEAMVLGNNEGLTFTPDILAEVIGRHAKFPVLGSNIREHATGQPPAWMEPYLIVNKSDIRIGLIGVTAAYGDFYDLLGWKVTDPIEATAFYTRQLRPQVDVLIVMSHLGLRMDERLAQEVEGIDLILGGHTHHLIEEPLQVGGSYLLATGKFGRYAGHVELQFDAVERRIVGVAGRVVDLSDAESDSSIAKLLLEYQQSSRKALDCVVAQLGEPLRLDWYGESQLGNLVAAGLRRHTGAEVGLVNAGQLLRGLKEGEVTRGQLLEICPGPINPCRCRLAGSDLLQALEESLLAEFMEKRIFGYGFRGEVLGVLCLDGIQVVYDPDRQPYERILSVSVNGSPLELERDYVVGMIDMFTFGAGYLSLSKGRDIEYLLPEFLRDVLSDQLLDQEAVRISSCLDHWVEKSSLSLEEEPHAWE